MAEQNQKINQNQKPQEITIEQACGQAHQMLYGFYRAKEAYDTEVKKANDFYLTLIQIIDGLNKSNNEAMGKIKTLEDEIVELKKSTVEENKAVTQ